MKPMMKNMGLISQADLYPRFTFAQEQMSAFPTKADITIKLF